MRIRSVVLILLGLLLMGGAAGLTLYNLNEGEEALAHAEEALVPLREVVEQRQEAGELPSVSKSDLIYAEAVHEFPEMPVETIDGVDYLGILEIPDLDISLPVTADWDYDLLRIAACRYSGSYYERNLTVCAHNFIPLFRPLLTIPMDTDVFFTNVEGVVFHYRVSNRETVQPTEISRMIDNNGEWDLTLFTCFPGGKTRCAVRCDQVG